MAGFQVTTEVPAIAFILIGCDETSHCSTRRLQPRKQHIRLRKQFKTDGSKIGRMNRVLLWLIVAAVLLVGIVLYRSRPRDA